MEYPQNMTELLTRKQRRVLHLFLLAYAVALLLTGLFYHTAFVVVACCAASFPPLGIGFLLTRMMNDPRLR